MTTSHVLTGDVLKRLAELGDRSIQCCITSPPYWGLRDYGMKGQLGMEKTPDEFVARMVAVFREVRRVLRNDGTLWLNIGDSYAGSGKGAWDNKHGGQKEVYIPDSDSPQTSIPKTPNGMKPKDLVGIPWMLALALRADGWYLRQDIVWAKPNPMPESVTDRCTKSHEYLFLLTKSAKYYFDHEAIKEPCAQDERRPTFRGGAYVNNSTFNNAEGGKSVDTGNIRVGPSSWKGSEFPTGKTAEHQLGRASKNRSRKGVTEYERSSTEEHRTKAGLLKISEIAYPTRNKRDVWTIATQPFKESHFATFPVKLVEPCLLAGTGEGSTVLDPFCGSGTVGVVAKMYDCSFIGIELNPKYAAMARRRIASGK